MGKEKGKMRRADLTHYNSLIARYFNTPSSELSDLTREIIQNVTKITKSDKSKGYVFVSRLRGRSSFEPFEEYSESSKYLGRIVLRAFVDYEKGLAGLSWKAGGKR